MVEPQNMRVVSLLPAATEMVHLVGRGENLVGRSHECDFPASIKSVPAVVESVLDPALSPREIDEEVRLAVAEGRSLYRLNESLLRELQPTHLISQALCDVCGPARSFTQQALQIMGPHLSFLELSPHSLQDVWQNILDVGVFLDQEHRALDWLSTTDSRLAWIRKSLQEESVRRVVCLEWLDPLFGAGHWIPEMVRWAGGEDLTGCAGGRSTQLEPALVLTADPELIIGMPCGYDLNSATSQMRGWISKAPWSEMRAVQEGGVYAVDANQYLVRPGPRLLEGVEILASIFHPSLFPTKQSGFRQVVPV